MDSSKVSGNQSQDTNVELVRLLEECAGIALNNGEHAIWKRCQEYAGHLKGAGRSLERENAALREALRYWMPDETLVEPPHQAAWDSHTALLEKQ